MDKKTEALKLALEALELHGQQYPHMVKGYCLDAITAIREALAEQPAQKRPQNCGTGYCSCIECVMEQPAQQQCRTDGRCQYAIDSGAEGMGHCPKGKCVMPVQQQEPVAWMHPDGRIWTFGRGLDKSTFTVPLYTSPQSAPVAKPHEQQEPVAWMDAEGDVYKEEPPEGWCPPHVPLYTSPPASKPWVGLTDEQISDMWDGHTVPVFGKTGINPIVFARAIEAKLREKNEHREKFA